MRDGYRISLAAQRALAVAFGVAAALACLHVLLTSVPEPPPRIHGVKPLSVASFAMRLPEAMGPGRYSFLLETLAVLELGMAGLGIYTARNALKVAPARQLMAALCYGGFGLAWFTFINASGPMIELAQDHAGLAVALDAVGAAAGAYACALMARFFLWFPRLLTAEEWCDYLSRPRPEDSRSLRWWRTLVLRGGFSLLRTDGLSSRRRMEREYRWLTQAPTALWVAAISAASMFFAHLIVSPQTTEWVRQLSPVAKTMTMIVFVMAGLLPMSLLPVITIGLTQRAIIMQHELGSEEQRRQIDWLYWPYVAISGLLTVGAIAGLFWLALLWATGAPSLDLTLSLFPVLLLPGLPIALTFVFLIGLAIAVLYGGAVDPKLAVGKVSAWTLLAIVLTVVFLIAERFLARAIVDYFGWGRDNGSIVAGALVAATFAPLRKQTERTMNIVVERWAPARLAEGERVNRTICFTDISGYSAVSVSDEPRALLLAAVLQQQARRVTAAHAGRVVKSLGDAVILEFENASDALTAIEDLHTAYPKACAVVAIDALPLHTGIHSGEVMLRSDGDVLGGTVNLASRLQDFAKAGEIVMSDVALQASGMQPQRVLPLGAQSFKNIPVPVHCFRLLESLPAASEASTASPADDAARAAA